MDLALQFVRYQHYARIYIERNGKFLVCWEIPTKKPNSGHKTFKSAADAIGTYTLYETLIDKHYERDKGPQRERSIFNQSQNNKNHNKNET